MAERGLACQGDPSGEAYTGSRFHEQGALPASLAWYSLNEPRPSFRCGSRRGPRRAALNSQYAAADKLRDGRGYGVANESPSSTVQPSGKPISFSHSFQVKFLAT